jgi:hypothetical protein
MSKQPKKDAVPRKDGDAETKPHALPMVPASDTKPAATDPSTDHAEADPLAKWRAAREMEEEMSDVFDEDRVTHRHGDTEPEAD